MHLLRVGCQFGKTVHLLFIFVDVVHLFPALCPTIEVRHPRTSRSVEHLVIFGATIFPVAKLFDNSSVDRFLILSNLELQFQANLIKL